MPLLGSLAGRLMIWFLAASFLLVLIASAILYWGTVEALRSADEQVLQKRAEALHTVVADGNLDAALISHEVNEELTGPRQVFVRLISPAGETIDETQQMSRAVPRNLFPISPADGGFLELETPDGRTFLAYTIHVRLGSVDTAPVGLIQAASDTTYDEQALAWFEKLLMAVITAAALACALTGWFIVRRELAPLTAIRDAASQIDKKTLSHRLTLDGLPAEIGDLGQQFNAMLERLQTAYEGLRQYADNVAHELRSPVNRMLLGSEVVLTKKRSSKGYREALESNMEECQQLKEMVERLLFLARAENTDVALDRKHLEVTDEIEIIRNLFEASAEEAGLSLDASCEPNLAICADRVLFQRAISNLVANAIAHTAAGGRVSISARAADGAVAIIVADTGRGIAPEAQKHVFDRFYRADAVRSNKGAHLGLGLPIAKSIIDLHGGTISLDSQLNCGTSLTVRMPSAASHQAAA
jgi:two-component system heavy metal sensor histidine kinase CusS